MKPAQGLESGELGDPDFGDRVRASFARQRLMRTLGAELAAVRRGEVEIELPFRDELTHNSTATFTLPPSRPSLTARAGTQR